MFKMKIYNELESLGFFKWLSEIHNLKDIDMKPEYLDELSLNDIHRTVCNSMAFKWFREKQLLEGLILPQEKSLLSPLPLYFIAVESYRDNIWVELFNSTEESNRLHYETYEQAESACIDKLISILKEKQ